MLKKQNITVHAENNQDVEEKTENTSAKIEVDSQLISKKKEISKDGDEKAKDGDEKAKDGDEKAKDGDKKETKDGDEEDDGPPPSFGTLFTVSRPEWPALIFAFILMIIGELAGQAPPLILARAYDALVNPALDTPDKRSAVRDAMFLVFALHGGGSFIGWLRGNIMGIAGERVVARLRGRLYKSMLRQEIGFFDARKTGSLISRLGSDTTLVQGVTTSSVPEAIIAFIKIGVSMTLMFYITIKLTGIVLGTAAAIFLFCIPFAMWMGKISKRYQNALADAQGLATECLGAMRTVRAFVGEQNEAKRYEDRVGKPTLSKCWYPSSEDKDSDSTYYLGVLKVLVSGIFFQLIFGLGFGAMYLTMWLGFEMYIDGELSLGMIMAFQSYIFQIGMGLGGLSGHMVQIVTVKGASQRIFTLLDRIPAILPKSEGCVSLPKNLQGNIEFENVFFSYPTRTDVDVLQGFSLKVPAKSVAALVGSSGSGKSTVVALLQRFYDVNQGCIRIDDIDIRDLDPNDLHSQIGFVQQEPALFGMTVRENVCYGVRGEKTDEEVEEACRQANAHDFINEFPDKYSTLVGERGVRLSGGQKQRICIARALLINPRILLLDEATSALDAESEHLVQQAINKVMVGRTTLVVAHRLSTVRDAHKIVMMDEHKIVDVGTHDVLLSRCEKYKELVQRQLDQKRKSLAEKRKSLSEKRKSLTEEKE